MPGSENVITANQNKTKLYSLLNTVERGGGGKKDGKGGRKVG